MLARCAEPPGRSLEPRSNARPRGMIVLPAMADRIRLTGPAADKDCVEGSLAMLGNFGGGG